jgi:hypothetical protein
LHVRAVTFYLGDAAVSLEQRERVLFNYEHLAAVIPEIFGTQAIELWDETLRTVPGATDYLTDAEARERAARIVGYRRHWEAFGSLLRIAINTPDTASIAHEYLPHLHAIIPE